MDQNRFFSHMTMSQAKTTNGSKFILPPRFLIIHKTPWNGFQINAATSFCDWLISISYQYWIKILKWGAPSRRMDGTTTMRKMCPTLSYPLSSLSWPLSHVTSKCIFLMFLSSNFLKQSSRVSGALIFISLSGVPRMISSSFKHLFVNINIHLCFHNAANWIRAVVTSIWAIFLTWAVVFSGDLRTVYVLESRKWKFLHGPSVGSVDP